MPIIADHNLYPGINPHLNSYLQDGHWESFHAVHIIHLMEALEATLPPEYGCLPEQSLQIVRTVVPDGPITASTIQLDVTVFHSYPSTGVSPTIAPTAPTQVLNLSEIQVETEEEPLTAVVIYRLFGESDGIPITRIELLSPSNKPGGSLYDSYVRKRLESLRAGLNLVEIDYLHESHPILPVLASYPDGATNAYPFTVIVSDPHPTFERGNARIYGFNVRDALPKIVLPLVDGEAITLDLGIPYEHTAVGVRVFRRRSDYSLLPRNFDRYQESDQAFIRQRIDEIAHEHNQP